MLIPDKDGRFYYHDIRVFHYQAFVDSNLCIIELITTEDGKQFVVKNKWDDLNDIEKHIALDRGWDIPADMAEREKEASSDSDSHDSNIIPFPLSS